MCLNTRLIRNKYTGKAVRVNCGKCVECQQEKANRRCVRIVNQLASNTGCVALFLTLTYRNDCCPYVLREEIQDGEYNLVSVHRDYYPFRKDNLPTDVCVISWKDFRKEFLKDLNNAPSGRVGVCLYDDLKKFKKRLKEYYKKYGKDWNYQYYFCSEYGEETDRPHFHGLVLCPCGDEQFFRVAVNKCWQMDDYTQDAKRVEYARKPASYLSAYVSKRSCLPSFLTCDLFRPRYSTSRYFGAKNNTFGIKALRESLGNGVTEYDKSIVQLGQEISKSVPYPRYIYNYFYPYFKGCTRLLDVDIFKVLRNTANLHSFPEIDYNEDDFKRINVRLNNAFKYWQSYTHGNIFDYAIEYTSLWRKFHSDTLRRSLENCDDFSDFYENGNEVNIGFVKAPTLSFPLHENTNTASWRLEQNAKLRNKSNEIETTRVLNSRAFRAQGSNY